MTRQGRIILTINKKESLNNFNKYIEVLKSDKNTIGRGNLLSKCIENLKDIGD